MRARRAAGATLTAALLAGIQAAALAAPVLEKIEASPPEALPGKVREALGSHRLRVADGDRTVVEIWLRRELKPLAAAAAAPGVNFAGIGEGTLVGAARFLSGGSDYRGRGIAAGVYTLRYALQPVDGNHVGISEFRDFLLLVPASADPGPEARPTRDELIELGRRASGRPHPAVLALVPVGAGETPALVEGPGSTWKLRASCGSIRLGVVVIGRADVEEIALARLHSGRPVLFFEPQGTYHHGRGIPARTRAWAPPIPGNRVSGF